MKRKNLYFRPWVERTLEIIFMMLTVMLLCLDDFALSLQTLAFLAGWVGTIVLLYRVLIRHSREFQKFINEMKEDEYNYGD